MTNRFRVAAAVFSIACFVMGTTCVSKVHAQTVGRGTGTTTRTGPGVSPSPSPNASPIATASAAPQPQISIPAQADLTQNNTETRSKLAVYLDEHPLQNPSPLNFIQRAIRNAVNRGVPANIIVLLLLFPVTASLIAIFRHVIGLRGFGVYTPAVLAVAFISTGITHGLILFIIIFVATMVGRALINRFKLQYLPRAALLLWLVSMVFFALVLLTPYYSVISIVDVLSVGIFPLLVLILLSENFLEAQQLGNPMSALRLTFETLFLAVISTLFMRTLGVQQFVILHPELIIVSVLIVDLLVGKYTGLRVTELLRFKSVMEPEE
ncbi:MAG TPA: 7TM domain-containing protein [Candidatus Saccharimonadia bacterium]|nr:7TM domain-containing protein [Candidatus Saccharimonadia bacterium]